MVAVVVVVNFFFPQSKCFELTFYLFLFFNYVKKSTELICVYEYVYVLFVCLLWFTRKSILLHFVQIWFFLLLTISISTIFYSQHLFFIFFVVFFVLFNHVFKIHNYHQRLYSFYFVYYQKFSLLSSNSIVVITFAAQFSQFISRFNLKLFFFLYYTIEMISQHCFHSLFISMSASLWIGFLSQ